MNDLETPPAHIENPNGEIESLRSQMNLLFGCILVASLTLTAFLGLQARRSSLEALALKGPAAELTQQMRQQDVGMSNTLAKLAEFARTHPDFQKVIRFNTNTNTAPTAAPAPSKK